VKGVRIMIPGVFFWCTHDTVVCLVVRRDTDDNENDDGWNDAVVEVAHMLIMPNMSITIFQLHGVIVLVMDIVTKCSFVVHGPNVETMEN
jgi:hypothetical protein